MIPVSTLYDEYIDWRKLTEQKKRNPFEYIVPPPSRGVGTKFHSRQLINYCSTFKITSFYHTIQCSRTLFYVIDRCLKSYYATYKRIYKRSYSLWVCLSENVQVSWQKFDSESKNMRHIAFKFLLTFFSNKKQSINWNWVSLAKKSCSVNAKLL